MKKLILLLALAAGLLIAGHFFLSGLVSKAIQSSSGVAVDIGRISFGLFPARFSVTDVKFRNPEGFEEKWMAVVPELAVELGGFNPAKKTVTIREVRLNLDSITLERSKKGQINAIELKKQLGRKRGAAAPPPQERDRPAPKPAPSQKAKPYSVQIQKAVVSLGTAAYVDYISPEPLRKEYKIGVEGRVLENISDPSALTEQVLTLALEKAGLSILEANWEKIGAQFSQEAAKIAGQAKTTLGGLFEQKTS